MIMFGESLTVCVAVWQFNVVQRFDTGAIVAPSPLHCHITSTCHSVHMPHYREHIILDI